MSFGWTQGEALKNGGLKRPILVKHKKDTKGLGHDMEAHDNWWERMFDGQLKGLDVTGAKSKDGVSFKQDEEKIARHVSPLYQMFVYGGILRGSVENEEEEEQMLERKRKRQDKSDRDEKKVKKDKKDKKSKKEKKSKSKKDKEKKSKMTSSEEDWIKSLVRAQRAPVAA